MEEAPQNLDECAICNTVISEQSKRLECGRCKDRLCIKCLKIKDSEYKILRRADFMWFCTECRPSVEKSISVDRTIEEKCREIFKEFQERILELENCVERKCNEERVREIVMEEIGQKHASVTKKEERVQTLDTVMTEISERKNRERNIVVYGIPDQNNPSGKERKKEDLSKIKNIFSACTVELQEEDVLQISRLGKYKSPEGNEISKRPILVVLGSEHIKRDLFRNISKLRNNDQFTGVNISNDMTLNERRTEKKLRDEAKEKEERSSGEFVFRVRGPPWARRVVKIAKKDQSDVMKARSNR